MKVEVLDGEAPKDAYQGLAGELIALTRGFAGKLYGMGSNKYMAGLSSEWKTRANQVWHTNKRADTKLRRGNFSN